jgi:hypothetical protein
MFCVWAHRPLALCYMYTAISRRVAAHLVSARMLTNGEGLRWCWGSLARLQGRIANRHPVVDGEKVHTLVAAVIVVVGQVMLVSAQFGCWNFDEDNKRTITEMRFIRYTDSRDPKVNLGVCGKCVTGANLLYLKAPHCTG